MISPVYFPVDGINQCGGVVVDGVPVESGVLVDSDGVNQSCGVNQSESSKLFLNLNRY
jgi:hypothetical protein